MLINKTFFFIFNKCFFNKLLFLNLCEYLYLEKKNVFIGKYFFNNYSEIQILI